MFYKGTSNALREVKNDQLSLWYYLWESITNQQGTHSAEVLKKNEGSGQRVTALHESAVRIYRSWFSS